MSTNLRRTVLLLASAALLAGSGTTYAQSSTCLGPDSLSNILLTDVLAYSTGIDSVLQIARDSLRIPATLDVALVTKSSVCTKAQAAYAANVPSHPERLSGQVYVVRAGTTYSVWDPAWYITDPESATVMHFDSHWVLLSVRH